MPAERSGEAVLTGMVKAASELVAERSYEGESARDLQRFSQYQEVGSGIRLVKEDISLTQLYAGLAVLCREGYAHVQSLENSQHPALRDVVTDVMLEERRRYGHGAFPYDDPHFPHKEKLASFPTGLLVGSPDAKSLFRALKTRQILHEWTVKPGRRLHVRWIERAGTALRRAVCGHGGLVHKVDAHEFKIELAKDFVVLLLAHLGNDQFYIPIVATVAVIETKRGLSKFCSAE